MDRPPSARLRFGRHELEARAGEPLLAALARRGWPSLTRSIRYHRPRGPFCGVGDCTGCLVRADGRPNVRACLRPVADGMRVTTENAWPGPRFDLLAVLDRLWPSGFDSVRGFTRPAFLTGTYQRVVRRLAGYGRPPDAEAATSTPPPRLLRAEVAIIGGGRAGEAVAAALGLRKEGSVLLERRRELEGTAPPVGELLLGTTATILSASGGGPPAGFSIVGFRADGAGVLVRAERVVVATGSYDGPLLFEGCDRPGVVTADLAMSGLTMPFGRSVVVGGGPRALSVVERLGDGVDAVVGLGEIRPELARAANDRGIEMYPRSRVVRAIGHSHLRSIELARRDGSGSFRLACDTLVLAHRRLPNAQLLVQTGARRSWREPPGAYYADVDAHGRTSVPGLFAVGSAAAPGTGPDPQLTAVTLGATATDVVAAPPASGKPGELAGYYRELLREPRRGKWVLCPCEDVLLGEVEEAVRRGYRGLEIVKRYTGVGTGLCQGRYCLPEAIAVLSVLEGRPPEEVGAITQRPPLTPTPLAALASLASEFDREVPP